MSLVGKGSRNWKPPSVADVRAQGTSNVLGLMSKRRRIVINNLMASLLIGILVLYLISFDTLIVSETLFY